jgi:hypothetical protein
MEFEHFALVRDLLCLAGAFAGAGIGLILTLFRRTGSIRGNNQRIVIIFCLFSGMVAFFALAFIFSAGAVFRYGPVFVPAGFFVLIFAAAVFFPRAAAFPLIIAAGFITVWAGFSFLRFPLVLETPAPLAVIQNRGDGQLSITLGEKEGRGSKPGKGGDPVSLQFSGPAGSLEFSAFFIKANALLPLIGGQERGTITMVRQNGGVIYKHPSAGSRLLGAYYRLFSSTGENGHRALVFHQAEVRSPGAAIPPGMSMAVLYRDQSLVFKGSWEP